MTAKMDGDFVIFLIGMRINRPWKVHKWLPVARAMPGMIRELSQSPETGFLGGESWFGRTIIFVQYWRTLEQLLAYARNTDGRHLPAWRAFNQSIGTGGDVGIWHETYRIAAGAHESIYVNMPPFGLGRAGRLEAVGGRTETAEGRLGAESSS